MDALLADRVAVVTGGGGGIGRGIATRFASEGASVVVAEIDADRAADTVSTIVAAGGTAVGEVVDVCTPGGAEHAVDRAIAEFGRIDVMVNNVGHFGGAEGVPREHRRGVGRAVPSEPRTRAAVHAPRCCTCSIGPRAAAS